MNMLEQIEKIREEIENMTDEDLLSIIAQVKPEEAERFAILEEFIMNSHKPNSD